MGMRRNSAVLVPVAVLLAGCGDECQEYSDFSCEAIQNADYNVYFYFPNDREKYLGVARSLDACGSRAYSYADREGLDKDDEWDYICCMKAKGSECYEKHK